MMTTHEPTVLLLDLGERNAEFTQALAQVGRPAVAITVAQLAEAFRTLAPMCVVTHREHVSAVVEQIKLLDRLRPLPFFVLARDQPGSMRPPSPEVTACVPEGIEPGILALRIQQALQEAGGPRPRQTTVLGLGNFSRPQVLPTSAAPPNKPALAVKAAPALPSAPALPPASSLVVPSTPPPAPSLPPSQSVAPSVPPLAPTAALPSTLPSTPPLGSAPPPASAPPVAPITAAPSVPPSLGDPVPTNAPVAISQSGVIPAGDSFAPKGSRKSLLPKLLAVAGVVGVLGAGGFMAWKSSSNAAQAETPPKPDVTTDGAKPSGVAAAAAKPAPAEGAKSPDTATPVPAVAPPQETTAIKASGEASFYKIPSPASATKCEDALGKSESDFATEKTWRASQVWKLARRSLMAGKEEDALKHMCESAFIDPAGPATAGLVKYYLGKRALDEAHSWAKRGVEAAKSASSKRAAQQMLGDVLSQLGQVDDARKIWLESFNLTADQTDRLAPVCRNFLNAALKSRKGGDSPLAEQLLRRAATFSPEDATVAAVLASTLLDNDQPALAELWANRALKLKPNLEMAQGVLSQLKK